MEKPKHQSSTQPKTQTQKQIESKPKSRKKSTSKRTQTSNKTQTNKSIQKQDLADKIRTKKQHKQTQNKQQPQPKKGLITHVGQYQFNQQLVLGRGMYGQVYKVHLIQKPQQVFACKLIRRRLLQKQRVYGTNGINGITLLQQRLKKQIQIQKQLSNCKYIVKMYDAIYDQNQGYYLFMEMCDIDLGKLIQVRGNHLPQNQALQFFKQLLKGYKYLYDRNICHRDLKPQNLLIKGGKNLKISDFGFVKIQQNDPQADLMLKSSQREQFLAQSCVGSINYIAPDILLVNQQKKKYNPYKSDVWSMGIIMYKMLYGKQPYQSQKQNILLQKILNQPLVFPQQPKISQKTIKLMKRMIQKNPQQRIQFKQLYKQVVGQYKQQNKNNPTQNSFSQKQKLLYIYNILITKISYDSSYYATLRQIGIEQYQKYSAKLMTLIHQKRVQILKSDKNIREQIKKQITSYTQNFYTYIRQSISHSSIILPLPAITNSTTLQITTLLAKQLQIFINLFKQYTEFQMLHQEVQYYLLLLLLLYNYQKGFISLDYFYTIIQKQKSKKLNYKKLEDLTAKNLKYQ